MERDLIDMLDNLEYVLRWLNKLDEVHVVALIGQLAKIKELNTIPQLEDFVAMADIE